MAKRKRPMTLREQAESAAALKVPFEIRVKFYDAYLTKSTDGHCILIHEAAKAAGISIKAAWGIVANPPTPAQKARHEVKALPRETRQAFLDAMKDGKTIGEAQALTGLSFNVALVLFRRAFKRHSFYTMDWNAK